MPSFKISRAKKNYHAIRYFYFDKLKLYRKIVFEMLKHVLKKVLHEIFRNVNS